MERSAIIAKTYMAVAGDSFRRSRLSNPRRPP